MIEIVTSEWFWGMAQCVVVALTGVLVLAQIRMQVNSHIVVASESILARWNAPSTLKLRKAVATRRLDGDMAFDAHGQALAEIIENISIYALHKAVPEKVLWDLLSWNIEHYYQLFQAGIEHERKAFKDPTLFSGIIDLHQRFREMSKDAGAGGFERSDEELVKFLAYEVSYCEVVLAAS